MLKNHSTKQQIKLTKKQIKKLRKKLLKIGRDNLTGSVIDLGDMIIDLRDYDPKVGKLKIYAKSKKVNDNLKRI